MPKIKHIKLEETIIIKNTHEAIIDKDTFDIVSDIRKKCKNTKIGYIPKIAGKINCSNCGGKLHYLNPREKYNIPAYFVCSGYRNKKEKKALHCKYFFSSYTTTLIIL